MFLCHGFGVARDSLPALVLFRGADDPFEGRLDHAVGSRTHFAMVITRAVTSYRRRLDGLSQGI